MDEYVTQTITPHIMASVLKMTDCQAEQTLFSRLRLLDRTEKLSHAERGYICRIVKEHRLHEQRLDNGHPCSMNRWITLACPWGHSTVFQAMKDVEDLKDIPPEHLAEIPQANFPVMKQLSTQVRSEPAVLEAAKTQQSEEFAQTIQRDYPDQHIQARKLLRFAPEESALVVIEEALRKAMELGAKNRSEALEYIALEALTQWQLDGTHTPLEIPPVPQSIPS